MTDHKECFIIEADLQEPLPPNEFKSDGTPTAQFTVNLV